VAERSLRDSWSFSQRSEENPVASAVTAWANLRFAQAIRRNRNPFRRFTDKNRPEPKAPESNAPEPPPTLARCRSVEETYLREHPIVPNVSKHTTTNAAEPSPREGVSVISRLAALSMRHSSDKLDPVEWSGNPRWSEDHESVLSVIKGSLHREGDVRTPRQITANVLSLIRLAAEVSETAPKDEQAIDRSLLRLDLAFRVLLNAARLAPDSPFVQVRLADLLAWAGCLRLATQLYIEAAEGFASENRDEGSANAFACAGLCWSAISDRLPMEQIAGNSALYTPERCFAAASISYRGRGIRNSASVCFVWSRNNSDLEEGGPTRRCLSLVPGLLSKYLWTYGESPGRVLVVATLTVLTFALFYTQTGFCESVSKRGCKVESAPPAGSVASSDNLSPSGVVGLAGGLPPVVTVQRSLVAAPTPPWNSLVAAVAPLVSAAYFSMATFTSLGFGDIHPGEYSTTRFLVVVESLLGTACISAFLITVQRRYAN